MLRACTNGTNQNFHLWICRLGIMGEQTQGGLNLVFSANSHVLLLRSFLVRVPGCARCLEESKSFRFSVQWQWVLRVSAGIYKSEMWGKIVSWWLSLASPPIIPPGSEHKSGWTLRTMITHRMTQTSQLRTRIWWVNWFFYQSYFHYLPSIAIGHDACFSMFFAKYSKTPFEKW